jgi:signal transduction histidine kinase
MNLLVSAVVLLLATSAFFSYDLLSFRHNLIRTLEGEAQIVGDNSVSAVLFNDPQSATATLASLANVPDVVGGVLRLPTGPVFARYGPVAPRDGTPIHTLAPGEINHVWPSANSRLLLAHRVVFQGKTEGVVYIVASTHEIALRARRYGLIALTIFVLCMLAGVVISATARRLIAEPITQLADTARTVSRERDYSVRADVAADSREIRTLVHAFNAMLGQIQERDAALTEARDQLEARVAERTAELQAANRELEAFSYTVAHDLRGPLDAITGIVYLLGEMGKECPPDQEREMLDQLQDSTANMAMLIEDLLSFARANTAPVKREPVDLSALARDIAEELQRTDPARQVEFVIADTPEVMADAGLLRIVLDNLLRNAWKYTSHHEQARIEFGAGMFGGKPAYFVRDDGAGFDPSLMDQLFHPFQRLHGKNEFPGTGIGLATVQRILMRLGGTIWAVGEVEKGATFYFTF